MIAPVGDDPQLAAAIAFRLGAGIGKVQRLGAFHLNVEPRQCRADDIRTPGPAGKLLTTSSVEAMLAQQRRKLALTPLAFFAGVHRTRFLSPIGWERVVRSAG
jgi:hypothetical protein